MTLRWYVGFFLLLSVEGKFIHLGSGECISQGIGLNASKSTVAGSISTCEALCSNASKCFGFTYTKTTGVCQIYQTGPITATNGQANKGECFYFDTCYQQTCSGSCGLNAGCCWDTTNLNSTEEGTCVSCIPNKLTPNKTVDLTLGELSSCPICLRLEASSCKNFPSCSWAHSFHREEGERICVPKTFTCTEADVPAVVAIPESESRYQSIQGSNCEAQGYEYIQSAMECAEAASQLRLDDVSPCHITNKHNYGTMTCCSDSKAQFTYATNLPYGCYFRPTNQASNKLWYNPFGDRDNNATFDRQSLCRVTRTTTISTSSSTITVSSKTLSSKTILEVSTDMISQTVTSNVSTSVTQDLLETTARTTSMKSTSIKNNFDKPTVTSLHSSVTSTMTSLNGIVQTNSGKDTPELGLGIAVGIGVGCLVLGCILAFCCLRLMKRKNDDQLTDELGLRQTKPMLSAENLRQLHATNKSKGSQGTNTTGSGMSLRLEMGLFDGNSPRALYAEVDDKVVELNGRTITTTTTTTSSSSGENSVQVNIAVNPATAYSDLTPQQGSYYLQPRAQYASPYASVDTNNTYCSTLNSDSSMESHKYDKFLMPEGGFVGHDYRTAGNPTSPDQKPPAYDYRDSQPQTTDEVLLNPSFGFKETTTEDQGNNRLSQEFQYEELSAHRKRLSTFPPQEVYDVPPEQSGVETDRGPDPFAEVSANRTVPRTDSYSGAVTGEEGEGTPNSKNVEQPQYSKIEDPEVDNQKGDSDNSYDEMKRRSKLEEEEKIKRQALQQSIPNAGKPKKKKKVPKPAKISKKKETPSEDVLYDTGRLPGIDSSLESEDIKSFQNDQKARLYSQIDRSSKISRRSSEQDVPSEDIKYLTASKLALGETKTMERQGPSVVYSTILTNPTDDTASIFGQA
eukprot:m.338504 g.338504  ORF g.338504 m.338504 type:complete len:909 (+) comp18446_c0_seq1:361-3087(+)